jgi:hypothetical protein
MKGDYNSASTYEALDAVSYQNGLYVAKQNVPAGITPANTAYWQCAIDAGSLLPRGYASVDELSTDTDYTADADGVLICSISTGGVATFWSNSLTAGFIISGGASNSNTTTFQIFTGMNFRLITSSGTAALTYLRYRYT